MTKFRVQMTNDRMHATGDHVRARRDRTRVIHCHVHVTGGFVRKSSSGSSGSSGGYGASVPVSPRGTEEFRGTEERMKTEIAGGVPLCVRRVSKDCGARQ